LTRGSPSCESRRRDTASYSYKPLLRLGGGLDVPFVERLRERPRDFRREQRLAGAGFAFDEQRATTGPWRRVTADISSSVAM